MPIESPSVSRRWRALTYKSSKQCVTSSGQSSAVSNVAEALADVLLISGVHMAPHDIHLKVLERVSVKIEAILGIIETLRRMFYEDAVSCDLKLVEPRSNEQFDPDTMDDVNVKVQEPLEARPKVLCTVEVGLMSYETIPDRKSHGTVLLKAKVVSEAMADEIFHASAKG